MATSARVLADSISPDGVRLTTLECIYPRIIHAEMMTHRVFSRNAASSRAIPVQKMIAAVQEDPYVPSVWGINQKGMQSEKFLDDPGEVMKARVLWLRARDAAVEKAERLLDVGIHKQWVNRLLEPFHWYTCIITATEWDNFFNLRNHPAAHPEIKLVAELILEAKINSTPKSLNYGEWHLPLIDETDYIQVAKHVQRDEVSVVPSLCKVSVGRCARVSYLTHDGRRDPKADIELHDRLLEAGHMSPFEHVARPMTSAEQRSLTPFGELDRDGQSDSIPFSGNFRGWVQYRKTIPYEDNILATFRRSI
jgi:thymidylate synthase ThyX